MTTIRTCSYLSCPASYDVVMVFTGQATVGDWRQWNTLGLRMCPTHSPLWVAADGTPGPHAPGLDTTGDTPAVTCGCGWRQDTEGLTAGEAATRYLEHLHAVAEEDR